LRARGLTRRRGIGTGDKSIQFAVHIFYLPRFQRGKGYPQIIAAKSDNAYTVPGKKLPAHIFSLHTHRLKTHKIA
jgi:hypothetical protein